MQDRESKKKVVMSRLVRWKEMDHSFDIEFWNKIGIPGKLEAAWQMVLDLARINPKYAPQLGLRRSHTLLKRRQG